MIAIEPHVDCYGGSVLIDGIVVTKVGDDKRALYKTVDNREDRIIQTAQRKDDVVNKSSKLISVLVEADVAKESILYFVWRFGDR